MARTQANPSCRISAPKNFISFGNAVANFIGTPKDNYQEESVLFTFVALNFSQETLHSPLVRCSLSWMLVCYEHVAWGVRNISIASFIIISSWVCRRWKIQFIKFLKDSDWHASSCDKKPNAMVFPGYTI